MIVLIDNYDSFSYNLYQLLGQFDARIAVVRNDEKTVAEIEAMEPDHLVISPGPGRPADAGICEQAIRCFAGKIPIMGVCLGHQAICEVYGCTITYAKQLMHGKQSVAEFRTDSPLFNGLPEKIDVGRYHSLAADPDTLSDELIVLAATADNEIMAVGHRRYAVYGLQFHPESILTPEGPIIIRNFLDMKQGCL
ncbi:anthranilate synthase component II [Megasphaera cerevisiae]|jgi:anthranilate synthase component 2|uniref:anthranilate synthase component II n=1 Tax=Megasphaera cerevisiae TaxID=39029 RepID=UPI000942AE36|nr:aminodeoxychorismate/anthranilate synthase component II [Megasphaera cerevisiae]OKY54542.1 aminodeoxychorismate/anthranilate synthase component II [Megasphaera cerevisiae]